MKRFTALVALAAFAGAPTLHAQAVVDGPRPLDAAHTRVRDQLLVLRDTLQLVYASAARFERDPQASAALLVSRARVMGAACRSSLQTLPPVRQTVERARLEPPRPKEPEMRAALLRSMDQLTAALTSCEQEFTAMSQKLDQASTIKDAAGNRGYRVVQVLRRYDHALTEFFASAGIDVRPLGAGKSTLAG